MNAIGMWLFLGSILVLLVNEGIRGKYGWVSDRHFVAFWMVWAIVLSAMSLSLGIAVREAIEKASASPESVWFGKSFNASFTSIIIALGCILAILINEGIRLKRGGSMTYVIVWILVFCGLAVSLGLVIKDIFA